MAQWHGLHPSRKFSSFLKQIDPAYSSFREQLLGWSFFQTTLKLCLGKHYVERARQSHWASSQAEKMIVYQCLSLVLVLFWFAGIDEVDGISMVVNYVICG